MSIFTLFLLHQVIDNPIKCMYIFVIMTISSLNEGTILIILKIYFIADQPKDKSKKGKEVQALRHGKTSKTLLVIKVKFIYLQYKKDHL